MIDAFYIKDYKNLKDFLIEPLSMITLISGKNGIGKTNLLQCIHDVHPGSIICSENVISQDIINNFVDNEAMISVLKTIEPEIEKLLTIPNSISKTVLKIATLILAIIKNPVGLALIDDFIGSIHYKIMGSIFLDITNIALHHNCQMIISTQSYEIIAAMYKCLNIDNQKHISFFRMEDMNGKTETEFYDSNSLGKSIQNVWELR